VALLAGALVPASPASADAPDRRFTISVRATIMDREDWFDSDVECVRHARFSTVLSADDGVLSGFFPWSAVDDGRLIGDPILYYFCGDEVSVCFDSLGTGLPYQKSTAQVSTDGTLSVNLRVTWYEADLLQIPCNYYDWFATRQVQFTIPPGQHSCRTVHQANSDDDYATLDICVSNLDPSAASLLESPPPTVSQLFCEGATRSYSCDATVSAPGGLSKIAWFVNDQEIGALQNQTSVTRTCAANATVRVRVTVTDRQNRTATRSTSVQCRANPN
jgi:hypothetical protein